MRQENVWRFTPSLRYVQSLTMTGFPVSLLLVGMIYTGTKAIQYLSIPVYTIFKNLTIIITAYGEVLWFGGSVSRLTLFSFGLIVLSSVVAAWADIQHALQSYGHASDVTSAKISTLNAGYMWMLVNCFCTSSYVLGMRKRIKLTNFKDFDSKVTQHLLSIYCGANEYLSHVLQQSTLHTRSRSLLSHSGGLVSCQHCQEFPHRDAK
jgi:UDP-galactose transporter